MSLPKKTRLRGGTLDIESYPGSWRTFANNTYEAKLMREVTPNMPASFSFKPWGRGKTVTRGIWQYENPRDFMIDLWKVFDESDFIIGQNVKRFDHTQSNTFFTQFDLPNPSQVSEWHDTMLIARKNFRLPSYSLKYLLKFFRIGFKIETGGEELWFLCEAGDKHAQTKMLRYNQNDTVETEKLFKYFVENGWAPEPGAKYYTPGNGCIQCKSQNMQSRGKDIGRANGLVDGYMCKDCGKRNYTFPHTTWKELSPDFSEKTGVES